MHTATCLSRMYAFLLCLLGLFAAVVQAQEDRPTVTPEWAQKHGVDLNAKAAYFSYDDGPRGYVFALNVVRNGDVYFHMSGPITSSWLGVGFGTQMKDSLMIIAYPTANRTNTTISTRIGTGHTEPAYLPGYEITKVFSDPYAPNANTVTNNGTGNIIAHAICRGCATWPGGALDLNSTVQPFFFALGPNKTFGSNSYNGNIALHDVYGQFTMDMTVATNYTGDYGRVPAPNTPQFVFPPTDVAFAAYGSTVATNVTFVDDKNPGIHGLLMIAAFLIVFPFGTLVKLFLRKVVWHAAIQTIGVVLVVAGFGVAIKVSRLYLRSKDFNSGHQILGLLCVAGVIIQMGLGFVHHSIFARTKRPTPLGLVHIFLGPIVMFLGVVNGGIGFRFAGNWEYDLTYAMIVLGLAVVFFGLVGCMLVLRHRRRAYKADIDAEVPTFGPGNSGYHDIELRKPTFQTTYGEEPPTPYEPHTPYTANEEYLPYEPPTPYAAVVPYTPASAYTPDTPRTFSKMEITGYPLQGHSHGYGHE